MTDIHTANKQAIQPLRAALYDLDAATLPKTLQQVFAADAAIQLATPLETMLGPDALYEQAYQPLIHAIPDLERRDYILMAGPAEDKVAHWVGCAGNYIGVFERPWLDIPPTGHVVGMRYHEFFCIEEGKIVEMQALWDIPQVMMQARAWPMTPSLGVDWLAPAPATQDGIITAPRDDEHSAFSLQLVGDMLRDLGKSSEGPEAMQLDKRWHPKMLWYGPAGIGTNRRVQGFRNWHQIPFLRGMPDRVGDPAAGYFFADNDYVGFTAWPGMHMTISGDGWLGIPPLHRRITMRSLDFWRVEGNWIRENWVLVDLLHVYDQLGVDVFSRMRELTYRPTSTV